MRRTFVVLVVLVFPTLVPNDRCSATEQLPPRGPVPARPAVCIAPTATAPQIDGALDDACWESAVAVRPFNLSYQGRFAPYRAEAMLTYDAERLFIGFRCLDPDPARYPWLPWPPDRDQSVAEVLLATGIEEAFYKVAVTSKQKVYVTQPMANAVPWRAPVSAVMKRSGKAWTAEFAIPFAAVELPTPRPTAAWRINIGWRTPKCVDYSAWAVTHAWFYEPQYYGDLHFGGPAALTAELIEVAAPRPDRNLLPLSLSNRAASAAECDVLVTLEDERGTSAEWQQFVSVPAKGRTDVPARYVLEDGMTGIATVTARRTGETAPFFRQSIPIEVPANRKAYRAIQAALAALPPSVVGERSKLAAETEAIRAELKTLENGIVGGEASLETWDATAKPLERLLGRARKLLWRTDHDEQLGDAPFAVGSRHTLERTVRDRAYTGRPAETVCLAAARGEYESTQLLVIPLGQGLKDVEVSVSPLSGPGDAAIPKDAVEVRWAGFVQTRRPRYPVEYVGWFVDPLLPMSAALRVVPADALHQPLWLTLGVPSGIPAGVYTGDIKVQAAGLEPWPVRLRVRVYDFDLPTQPALRTSMWLNEGRIKDWYGWEEIPKDIHRKQMAFLLEHRINPTWFGPIGDDDDLAFQLERGLNLVMLGVASQWPLDEETERKISRYYDYFKKRDLLDLTFIYGQDEPSPGDYPKVRDTLKRVRERFPGVRRVCTAYPPVPTLEGAVDTWVVGPNLFNYGPVAERVAAGDELWLYLSASVRRPYVTNFYLDYTPLENRLISWYCWKYGAMGFLFWGINEWHSNNQPWSGRPEIDDAISAGKRWPEVPWNTWTYLNCNGDAQFIYPGTGGEFWSSSRMETIRDAFEDYDYFALLDKARARLAAANLPRTQSLLADAEELLTIGPPLASDLSNATSDPIVLLAKRRAIAEHLERILHVLAEDREPVGGER